MNQEQQRLLADLQYLQNIKKEDHIRICERLVYLGHLTQHQVRSVLMKYKMTHRGRIISYNHPDMEKFIPRLSIISRRMSSFMRRHRDRYPPIERTFRRNVYVKENYEDFGDNIINSYIMENPVEGWGIDFHWE